MKRSLGLGICLVLVTSGIGLPLVIASAAVTSGTKCMKVGPMFGSPRGEYARTETIIQVAGVERTTWRLVASQT